jgi:glycerol-3-phosphate dehydrogenase (NAD(P)+)
VIGVIGCGSWGTALAAVLARKAPQQQYMIWGRDQNVVDEINKDHLNSKFTQHTLLPENLHATTDLAKLANNYQDLLLSIPSKAFTELLINLKPHITAHHRLVWATKGLEKDTGRFLHEVVVEMFPHCPLAILSGPSFATEVVNNIPSAVALASNNKQFLFDLTQAFQQDTFRIYPSLDIIGVQLGGVMKNIFAVAAGVGDGLGFGANTRAALLTRGLAEMHRLAIKLHAEPETIQGLAGLGDLILTCTDNKSRNRRFGLCLAQGMTVTQAENSVGVVEALHNVAEVYKIANTLNVDMPITSAVYELLFGGITAQQASQRLLSRKLPMPDLAE